MVTWWLLVTAALVLVANTVILVLVLVTSRIGSGILRGRSSSGSSSRGATDTIKYWHQMGLGVVAQEWPWCRRSLPRT